MGKAVARGSRLSIATQCLNDEDVSKHIIKKVCRMVRSEMEVLCSDRVDSALKHHSRDELINFKWSNVYDELRQHAPILLEILLAATATHCPRPNREALISMCAAMICITDYIIIIITYGTLFQLHVLKPVGLIYHIILTVTSKFSRT